MRSRLVDKAEYTAAQPVAVTKGTPLVQASEKYFANLEARGLDAKSIRTYRTGVDPLVQTCKKACVEDVTKQDMIDFMGWLRKQPLPKRRNSNPERTYSNKVGYVAIFLKEFGVSRLLKKKEYPRYHKKKVVAHPDSERPSPCPSLWGFRAAASFCRPISGCKHVEAAEVGNLAASTHVPPLPSSPVCPRFLRPHQKFSCQYFPSLAEHVRCANTGASRSLTSSCLSFSPSSYALSFCHSLFSAEFFVLFRYRYYSKIELRPRR